jgi:drug/metabolite transporter (DMT)-like permease
MATLTTGPIEGTAPGLWRAGQELSASLAFWVALTCYGLSVIVWVVGLSRLPVSQAYPVLSLGYILAALLAWVVLGEAVSLTRWAGIGLIIAGVVLVSRFQ